MRARSTPATLLAALLAVLVCGAGCALLPGERDEPGAQHAGQNSKALAETEAALSIVQRMSDYLASRPAFRFSAEVRYDAVQEAEQRAGEWAEQRIEFGSSRMLTVRRPDRLRVDVEHWDGATELLVYDGVRVSAASSSEQVYAQTAQSGTLALTLAHVQDELGVPTPFADLIDPQLYDRLRGLVEWGARVGTVRLDGKLCDQVAFRSPTLDFQLFVEQGDAPVPRRFVIDYREEPGSPQFRASLHDWETNPALPDELFRFAPPLGAQRVPFDELIELLFDPGASPEAAATWPADARRTAP